MNVEKRERSVWIYWNCFENLKGLMIRGITQKNKVVCCKYYKEIEIQLSFVNDSKTFWYLEREIRQEENSFGCHVNVNVFEVKRQLAKAKPYKAPGEDRISYEFIKNASDIYLKALPKVYTEIREGRTSYGVLKKSIIFSKYKKGDMNQSSNYKGISFMNVIAKIMLGIMHERISKLCEVYAKLMNIKKFFE